MAKLICKPLFVPCQLACAIAGLIPLVLTSPLQAMEFSFLNDEVNGSLDTTVSYGQLYRVQGQDKINNDVNSNDGNRNFNTGLVSEVYKITSDLEATYKNYGAFVRGTAFYDTQIMDKRSNYYDTSLPYQPSQSAPRDDHFTEETRDTAGHNAEVLDAYVYGNWDVADMPLTVRVGRQVFNWGEGLFYRGGVNTTNPVDAAKFRLPGAEVKEVLVPVEAIDFNIGLTDSLSLETFYQWNWKETAIDPVGTFFSETDVFAAGANSAYNNFTGSALVPAIPAYGSLGDASNPLNPALRATGLYQGGVNSAYGNFVKVTNITGDRNAKDDGQYGMALRYVAEQLNSTEFGFYYVNYHAKDPAVYADLNGYQGVNVGSLAGLVGAPTAGAFATIDILGNVQAKREYAENIRMYGMSFNSTIDDTSVFGELSYRPNLPIGIATTNDLLGDLILQAAKLADNSGALPGAGSAQIAGKTVTRDGAISNYERVENFNTSLGAIHNFGNVLSFDSVFGVAELASEHLRGSSLKYTAADGTVRYYSGRGNRSYLGGAPGTRDDQVNRNAYGYTLVLSGTWNDVYAGINLSPFAVYKHDFEGNSNQTGNFIEGRKAYSLGLKANYMSSLEAEVQYTEFYGAGQNFAGRDRDNVGINVKYSF